MNRHKYLITSVIIVCVIVIAFSAGCGTKEQTAQESKQKKKIAFVYRLPTNPFFIRMKEGFEHEIKYYEKKYQLIV